MQKNELAVRLTGLQERERKTQELEVRIRTQKESIDGQLSQAQEEAIAKFGTADLTVLREKFRKAKDADSQAIEEFESAVIMREEIIRTITESVDSLRLN